MIQLNVFCEGQTEQGFCTNVLQRHLFAQGTGIVHPLAVGLKKHHHLYGLGTARIYDRIRRFIWKSIKEREGDDVYFTTLFDLYALPSDFPGLEANIRDPANPTPYIAALEVAFGQSIGYHRFIPYLQLHEYETMLFAEPSAFAFSFDNCGPAIQKLEEIAASVASIEHIDDGKDTAPSKRIISLIPEYDWQKSAAGPDIAEYIGLPVIRTKCPHFDQWLKRLEALVGI